MKKLTKKQIINTVYSLIGLSIVVLVWFISASVIKNEYIMPSISDTLEQMLSFLGQANFYVALFWTLLRVLIAFLISFVLAGITAGVSLIIKPVADMVKPIVSIIRVLPTMAVLLLIKLWTKASIAPIVITTLVLYPMIYSQFITAFKSVDQGLQSAIKVFNLSKKDKFFKVYLPMVAPSIIYHAGSNLSFGIKLTVSAEVMVYTLVSLGGMMNTANVYLNIARLAGLTICAVLVGLLLESVFSILYRCCFKWAKAEVKDD